MSLAGTFLPKPTSWQAFEHSIWILAKPFIGDPNTQKNGRSGQKQNGVDVFGRRPNGNYVGFQCKDYYEKPIKEKELRSEVNKAKSFKPKLSEYIVATAAPRDKSIQEVARTITEELINTPHKMQVVVWGWEDVLDNAFNNSEIWDYLCPTYNPYVSKLSVEHQDINSNLQDIKSLLSHLPSLNNSSVASKDLNHQDDDENTKLHGLITACQTLINEGYVAAAVAQLTKLKTDEWPKASPSEKYRMLVAIASAELKKADFLKAGTILLEAFNECPDHKNARKNKCMGLLLLNRHADAAEYSRELLGIDSKNDYAAGTLIQALIEDKTCDDPLVSIDPDLYDKEDVLIARIHFLRCRENFEWIKLAKESALKSPDSAYLKKFSAEAVLQELINCHRDLLAGAILPQDFNQDEINKALDFIVNEANDALKKEYTLLPSVATNASMALRFNNQDAKAKDILDKAIEQNPKDVDIRLQRGLIAYVENDFEKVVSVLPSDQNNPECIGLITDALFCLGKYDDAIQMSKMANDAFPSHVKLSLLSTLIHIYLKTGKTDLAINTIKEKLISSPDNISLLNLLSFAYRISNDNANATKVFDRVIGLVTDETSLMTRLQLSHEAAKFDREDVIVTLLLDRVALDKDSDALQMLLSAAINSGQLATANRLLQTVSKTLGDVPWVRKVLAICAMNSGEILAEQKVISYLECNPDDVQMILALLSIWQHAGNIDRIKDYLSKLDFEKLQGPPDSLVKVAAIYGQYVDLLKGVDYGYSVMMNNWDNHKVHLSYQGLIVVSENFGLKLPSNREITENTAFEISGSNGTNQYRIERDTYKFFSEERLAINNDLAISLLGKKEGDVVDSQDKIGSTSIKVNWVKNKYIDIFHRSLNQFNERFPRANGLMKLMIDPNAADPFVEMKEIVKSTAERDKNILAEYQSKSFPLAFIASFIGKDPLEAWGGLPSVDIPFQVCRGTAEEREAAFDVIDKHKGKGCVLDAITLSLVRRLKLEKAVSAVCGPLYTAQSVIDLFSERSIKANYDIGKTQGFIGWKDGNIYLEEYSIEVVQKIAEERVKEIEWIRNTIISAAVIPKRDFSKDIKFVIDNLKHEVVDPAIAAESNSFLLLSEDMGYRGWACENFEISAAWLQPVLMIAKSRGELSQDEYNEAIISLAISNHTYVSLDKDILYYQAKKDNYELSSNLLKLIHVVGGPNADIVSNCNVMTEFIRLVIINCTDRFKNIRIISAIFESMTRSRNEPLKEIVDFILCSISHRTYRYVFKHALGWLIGHSIGTPFFVEHTSKEE